MNALRLFIITLLGIIIIGACQKTADQTLSEQNDLHKKGPMEYRAIPFKADFYTLRNYDEEGVGYCTEMPFVSFNYQVGEGNATHLGHFTTTMSFCADNLTFTYKNGEGEFVAANGDKLYFYIPSPDSVGHIIPIVDPLYELQFQDPFTFNGGTGRFEGALGEGYTNSFVNLFDDDGNFIPEHRTDHKWTGTLMLPIKTSNRQIQLKNGRRVNMF